MLLIHFAEVCGVVFHIWNDTVYSFDNYDGRPYVTFISLSW